VIGDGGKAGGSNGMPVESMLVRSDLEFRKLAKSRVQLLCIHAHGSTKKVEGRAGFPSCKLSHLGCLYTWS
jgi:hypothetical protein